MQGYYNITNQLILNRDMLIMYKYIQIDIQNKIEIKNYNCICKQTYYEYKGDSICKCNIFIINQECD